MDSWPLYRRIIALAVIAVLSFGVANIYATARQNHRLAQQLRKLENTRLAEERLHSQELQAFTDALTADERQLEALNQKPVATVDDVRAALAALVAASRSSSTTTTPRRSTTTTRPSTTPTTSRPPPPTTTTTRPTTTTTRCLIAKRVCR